jgi:hypothetical protein
MKSVDTYGHNKNGKIDALARRNINQMEDINVAKKGKF